MFDVFPEDEGLSFERLAIEIFVQIQKIELKSILYNEKSRWRFQREGRIWKDIFYGKVDGYGSETGVLKDSGQTFLKKENYYMCLTWKILSLTSKIWWATVSLTNQYARRLTISCPCYAACCDCAGYGLICLPDDG